MALRCDNCKKGILRGHAVSHAKNRLARVFYPNLQKLKVVSSGRVRKATLCTSCIKRLKKFGRIGKMSFVKYVPKAVKPKEERIPVSVEKKLEEKSKKEIKKEKPVKEVKKEVKKETKTLTKEKELQITDIVGQKTE